jgi:hypothetical protein
MGQNNPVDLISQYADPMVPYAKYPNYCGRVMYPDIPAGTETTG